MTPGDWATFETLTIIKSLMMELDVSNGQLLAVILGLLRARLEENPITCHIPL